MPKNFHSALNSKKMLLNASQRKYLEKRISGHCRKLLYGARQHETTEPPAVARARKLVADWEAADEARSIARRNMVEDVVESRSEQLSISLLFEDTETALAAVAAFEETTWEDYTKPAKKGPQWDKEPT